MKFQPSVPLEGQRQITKESPDSTRNEAADNRSAIAEDERVIPVLNRRVFLERAIRGATGIFLVGFPFTGESAEDDKSLRYALDNIDPSDLEKRIPFRILRRYIKDVRDSKSNYVMTNSGRLWRDVVQIYGVDENERIIRFDETVSDVLKLDWVLFEAVKKETPYSTEPALWREFFDKYLALLDKLSVIQSEREAACRFTTEKFYDKGDIIAIADAVLTVALEQGKYSVKQNKLIPMIQIAEERTGISHVSKDLRQVDLVNHILMALVNEAFKMGVKKFTPRFNRAKELLGKVDDFIYVEIGCKNAVAIYADWEFEAGTLGIYYRGMDSYVKIQNPPVLRQVKKISTALNTGSYQFFKANELEFLKSADHSRKDLMAPQFLEQIGEIAVVGLLKDTGVGTSEREIFDLMRTDTLHHEARHLADEILEIPYPTDADGKLLSNEAYAYIYEMAKGDLPHDNAINTFKGFLAQKILPRNETKLGRTLYTLNALASVTNISVSFDTDDRNQIAKGFRALMNLSKKELKAAALTVINQLRGNTDLQDLSVLNEINLVF